MPWMTKYLSYTSGELETLNGKGSGKVPKIVDGNISLRWVGSIVKHWTKTRTFDVKKWSATNIKIQHVETRDWQKYKIQGDIKTLLRRDCDVDKVMRFIKDVDIFEKKYELDNISI